MPLSRVAFDGFPVWSYVCQPVSLCATLVFFLGRRGGGIDTRPARSTRSIIVILAFRLGGVNGAKRPMQSWKSQMVSHSIHEIRGWYSSCFVWCWLPLFLTSLWSRRRIRYMHDILYTCICTHSIYPAIYYAYTEQAQRLRLDRWSEHKVVQSTADVARRLSIET